MFLRIYQHLLPNAKAWRLTAVKQLREFFDGLTSLPDDIKLFVDQIWQDIFPATTRQLDAWEEQFALPNTSLTEQQRRDRLDATWKALGGQSPRYIQDTLQNAGFDVYIHEWWDGTKTAVIPQCGNTLMICGSGNAICGASKSGIPNAIDPNSVLKDDAQATWWRTMCNPLPASQAQCGSGTAICGATIGPTGYPLVNILFVPDGGGGYERKEYSIPTDAMEWPYFIYIGGETFPESATVSAARRTEFETLMLKICPSQLWIGVLVDYT